MSRERPDDGYSTTRRAVLRTAAAGSGLAAAGGAAARRTSEPADYADPIEAEAAFGEHGADLLAELAADGVLAAGSVRELPTRRPADVGAVAAGVEGTAVVRGGGDRRFVSTAHVDGGVLRAVVEPATGTAYAFVETDASDRLLYDPGAGVAGVDTSSCFESCECLRIKCNDGSLVEECEVCCGDGCETQYGCCD